MTDLPLISCLCPTYNRRQFIPLAIETFLGQTYPNRELIILDDGTEEIADLIPEDPRIQYVYLPKKLHLGAKWNTLISLARGEIVNFWADDDWRHPRLLELLYQNLSNNPHPVTALREVAYVDLYNGDRWHFRPDAGVPDTALMFYKQIWRAHVIPDLDGPDSLNGWHEHLSVPGFEAAEGLKAKDLYIAARHSENSWRGHFSTSPWWSKDNAPAELPAFFRPLIASPEVGTRPQPKDTHTITFKVTGFTLGEGLLHWIMPGQRYAKRVAKKLLAGPYKDFDPAKGTLLVDLPAGVFRVASSAGDVEPSNEVTPAVM